MIQVLHFAAARLNLTVENGTAHSLRHLWRFDELFSSTVIVEFDKNADPGTRYR
jgi:ABC-type uncharacterized transport system substrate-binding protein